MFRSHYSIGMKAQREGTRGPALPGVRGGKRGAGKTNQRFCRLISRPIAATPKRANAAHEKPRFASSFETDFRDDGRPNSTGFARRRKTYSF